MKLKAFFASLNNFSIIPFRLREQCASVGGKNRNRHFDFGRGEPFCLDDFFLNYPIEEKKNLIFEELRALENQSKPESVTLQPETATNSVIIY